MLRIVRVHQHAGAWQMKIVQSREPEAQRGRAQHHRPRRALKRRPGPRRLVRAKQRRHALGLERRVVSDIGEAPIVRADGDVVEQAIDAGEVEIDHAGDAARLVEERVVAKEVAMHRSARQVGKALRRVEGELRVEQLGPRGFSRYAE